MNALPILAALIAATGTEACQNVKTTAKTIGKLLFLVLDKVVPSQSGLPLFSWKDDTWKDDTSKEETMEVLRSHLCDILAFQGKKTKHRKKSTKELLRELKTHFAASTAKTPTLEADRKSTTEADRVRYVHAKGRGSKIGANESGQTNPQLVQLCWRTEGSRGD